jgi:hypothetical protein
MLKVKPSQWVCLVVVLSGCAYAPPIQEMSDARQSVRAALDAGADRYLPTIMERVDARLADAEQQLEVADYQSAEQQALAAKNEAMRARTLVMNLTSTLEIVAQAERVPTFNPNTRTIVRQALEAASRGDEVVAVMLIDQARQEAKSVLADYDLERARVLATKLRNLSTGDSIPGEVLDAAETAISNHDGPRAYGLLAPYTSSP